MAEAIDEPIDLYTKQFKDKFRENCEQYFDELCKKANVSADQNKQLVKTYESKLNDQKLLEKKRSKVNTIKALMIILLVICIIGVIFSFVYLISVSKVAGIVVGILCAIGIVVSLAAFINVKKKNSNLDNEIANAQGKTKEALNACWNQMAPLNSEYDWNIPSDLMEKTTPLIDLDHEFDVKKFQYLHEKYGFEDSNDPKVSTNYVISGNIYGNPFVLINSFNTEMRDKVYSGSITIHWTTTTRDSKGNTQTQHHSQTLVATVTKKAPSYWYDTRLVYGNEAAPDLSFTRKPTVKKEMDEKDILKLEKSTEKELASLAEKAISKGKTFTPLSNSRFEGMFHAYDRDNEQQFRLLFTPLAQNNMCKLLMNSPYGDDFYFYKFKKLNYIFSNHSQTQNYLISPSQFAHYDIEKARTNFINVNANFFQGLYFDLAPLLSVPLYQQTKTHEYIYNIPYEAFHTKYEQEAMANKFNKNLLVHPESKTDAILKCNLVKKEKDADLVSITAYTYKTIKHVEVVTKLGGDGKLHNIPVEWLEYIPLERTSQMELANVDSSEKKYSSNYANFSNKNCVYERGLISALCQANGSSGIQDIINKIKKVEEK